MVRSRSRSPKGTRDRKRSRSKERDRRRDHFARRSRSRSPRRRRRSRSFSPRRRSRSRERERHRDFDRYEPSRSQDIHSEHSGSSSSTSKIQHVPPVVKLKAEDLEGKTKDEIEMMKLMGFGNFDTTKGKKVQGNDSSATNLTRKRRYRQYMNRRGGFNRPLDFIA